MKKYLIPETGKFYKANLHCHSTVSDGKLSPAELKKIYMEKGYSIIAYTDHDVMLPHFELQEENFLPLTGFEMEFNEWGKNDFSVTKTAHLCFIALSPEQRKQPNKPHAGYIFGGGKDYVHLVEYYDEPVFCIFANCASSACIDVNSVGRGAGDVNFAVLKPKRMDFRALRSVEMSVCKRFRDGFVFKLFSFYHRKAAEGVEFARADGSEVMVIVRCKAENSFSTHKHFVVYLRNVIVVAADDAAVVAYLHCVHALVCKVIFAVFK